MSEKELPPRLKDFVEATPWVFAKTYAKTWPHEYIVRDRVDEDLFLELVRHIREHGYQGSFYRKPITYFDHDGRVYWTMGEAVEKTVVVNRCLKEQSYEYRRDHGLLPESGPERPCVAVRESEGADRPTTMPMTMGEFRHPLDVARVQDVCALRFRGYDYEKLFPESEQATNSLCAWSHAVCETLTLHAEPLNNFAAFFALQRHLGKWAGVYDTKYSSAHVAFDFLFLHLYHRETPAEYRNPEYMEEWNALPQAEIEAAAAFVRHSFRRRGDGPANARATLARII